MRAPTYILVNLGSRIAQRRRDKGLSQNVLAAAAGLSPRTIDYIEMGQREPMVSTIMDIADTLGVTVEFLYRGR